MEKSYLRKVYEHNKKLFYACMLFISLTLFTNLLGWQVTPFFVWGMYSEKEIEKNDHTIYQTMHNQKSDQE